MPFFRCASDAEFAGVNLPRPTPRTPGNVPYVVDNIWEWLRPPSMPSRRFAIYASPSVQLARAGAAAPGRDISALRVGRVVAVGAIHAVQCPQQDAREHPDVRAIRECILKYLGSDWPGLPPEAKLPLGLLFLPGLGASEVNGFLTRAPELAAALHSASTFWSDVRPVSVEDPLQFQDGEVFFSAAEGYRLEEWSGGTAGA